MSRHEKRALTAGIERELEALDAALNGDPVHADYAPLGELTATLRSLRARPSEDFARALDGRAARGFARVLGPADTASAAPRRRRARRALMPAVGVALSTVLLAVLAISLSGGSDRRQPAPVPVVGRSAPVSVSPTLSVPSTPARGTASPPTGSAGAGTAAGAAASPSASAAPAARPLERTSTLEVGVAPDTIQSAAQRVFTLASAFGGYVRQSNVSSGAGAQGGANFDIRLPSANLSSAIAALSHLGHVRSENDTTNDVTDQLSSLERSIGGLQAERASLLRQLAAASEAQQEASLRARLHAVEVRISQLQGALGALRSRVDYTSLALSLTPEAAAGATSGDLTPGGAAHDAAQILEAALAVLVIAAAAALPLGSLILAAWLVAAIVRRRLREQALDASA
jgi:hypothetical protein